MKKVFVIKEAFIMAFMGILFLQIFMIVLTVWYFGTAFLSSAFFVLSIVLFIVNKKSKTESKTGIKKFAPIFTLSISIALFIPLLITSLMATVM